MSHILPLFLKVLPYLSCHVSHWLSCTQLQLWRKGVIPDLYLPEQKTFPLPKRFGGFFFSRDLEITWLKNEKQNKQKKPHIHTHTQVLVFGKLGEASIKLRLTREIVQNFKFSGLSVTLQMIISIFQPGIAWRIAPTLRLRLWFILTHHPAV